MRMTTGTVLLALAVAALGWKLFQLARAPEDRPLRVVVAFLATLTGAVVIQVVGVDDPSGALDAALVPGATRLGLNVLSLVFVYLLICFFVFTSGDPAGGRHARRELIPLLLAVVVLTVAMLATPEQARHHSYFGSMHPASIGGFYLTASAYIAYGTARSTRLAWRYAGQTDRRLALGLRIAAAGLLGCLLCDLAQLVSIIARWFGAALNLQYERLLLNLLVLSFAAFLAGVSYPGIVTRLASARRWLRHRHDYHGMRTLWALLNDAFPHDALERSPAPTRDRFGIRRMHHRAYRRVIECRDGLVQLSPYLAARLGTPDTGQIDTVSGADILAALQDRAAERPVRTTAVLVVSPAGPDLDDDVAALVRLSADIDRHLKRRHC